ncbi:RIP metalloprotease RseP [Paenisporosarcina cavernae]|uniref:Zinc metalloprotease n=1 Tax=Paenisporosarcina cavernae TaxID=2320858 RepID=A0A385YR83_9BACL|nr:RIP metalloprotease RseP [Paenisporosarcina cavernae]AYC29275.1 RIP metalloprotease RseP [Paenisporosarcina cavernae]
METTIAFILIFGSLVFFHELGHFIFAKRAGILVREFAIGFGPKIIGYTKGETIYTLRLLPIGGYVRMAGEDLDKIDLKPGYRIAIELNKKEEISKIILNQKNPSPQQLFVEVEKADLEKDLFVEGYDEEEKFVRYSVARSAVVVENGTETVLAPYDRQFNSKKLSQRAMAIFAGPLFNFILAFFIFLAIGLIQGVPTMEPVIFDTQENGPAAQSGLLKGDVVTKINGESIATWDDMARIIQENPNQQLDFTVSRDGQEKEMSIVADSIKNGEETVGQIGVYYQSPLEKNPLKAVQNGATQTVDWTIQIFQLLGKLITGQFSIDALSGPVGIYQATDEVAKFGVFSLMNWAAILSINLGIMNLLPLPALDGGRLLFFLFEGLRGKPIDRQKEGMVHLVGIMLLMVLMIVVTWNDIQRFFF